MDTADLIWNRACSPGNAPVLQGDRALSDILAFHGLSMSGGIAHAIEVLGVPRTRGAADGYRMMGSDQLGALLDEALVIAALAITDDGGFDSLNLDDETADLVDALDARLPYDSGIQALFRGYLAGHPDEVASP